MTYESIAFKNMDKVNKIICLETIEHLNDINGIDNFIEKLCDYLDTNGQMFLSFPVGENKPSEYNTFHLCEPDIQSIHNIMKKHFSIIEIETSKFVNNYDKECEYCFMKGIKWLKWKKKK